MEKIASFQIDHEVLVPGLYLSRTDGDIATYDLRCVKPNTPPYLENAVMHTVEHLFATYVRNSRFGEHVVYFGPMGCRTGFYFLTRGMTHEESIALTQDALHFIAQYTGEIPGATPEECGNYREHDLAGARPLAARMAELLKGWKKADLAYPVESEDI